MEKSGNFEIDLEKDTLPEKPSHFAYLISEHGVVISDVVVVVRVVLECTGTQ